GGVLRRVVVVAVRVLLRVFFFVLFGGVLGFGFVVFFCGGVGVCVFVCFFFLRWVPATTHRAGAGLWGVVLARRAGPRGLR
ncbi:hypothetical protein ACPTIV_29325, partial [Pseudomonas aeruginosa]|uniref:hypothetical protein n=1 Tax=Pseudomonas aeruginosa TaxID=287 RepID=UPI003CC525CF